MSEIVFWASCAVIFVILIGLLIFVPDAFA